MKQEFKQMDRNAEAKNYWEGPENKFIRLWVYAQRGLGEVNEFKYFILAFASGVALLYAKIPLKWVIVAGMVGVPLGLFVLILLGRWQLKKAAKVESWVSTEYSNPLQYKEYNIKVQTLETLERIEKKLDEKT